MSEILTESIARSWGASNAEEVIWAVCPGCAKANLDFLGTDFCPIQVHLGCDGEDEHVRCEATDRGSLRVWCTEFEEADK